MDDAQIRAILRSFVTATSSEIKPSQTDPADTLVAVLGAHAGFISVRNDIASAKVDIARARRFGSSMRSKLDRLQARLRILSADRQRIVTEAASSAAFDEACKRDMEAFVQRLLAWTDAKSLVQRILPILDQERLPSIVRPEPFSVLALINAVESHVEASPKAGSLMLMGMEPRPSGVEFLPRSASDLGLPNIFSGSVTLVVSPNTDEGKNAEIAGGLPARRNLNLVMSLAPDRRPPVLASWETLDPFLPRAARRVLEPMLPVCLPHSSPYSDLHKLLSVESWRAIRDEAVARCNSSCVVCGQSSSGAVKAEWSFNEPLRNSSSYGIQKLLAVNCFCSECSGVLMPLPSDLVTLAPNYEGYKRDREVYVVNPKMRRLARLNRWPDQSQVGGQVAVDPLAETVSLAQLAYQRRSRVRWVLDLEVLHSSNVALHPDMVMHPRGWIMRREDLQAFEDNRSVHFTRIFNASFASSTGQLHFFEMPPTHVLPWNTQVAGDQLAAFYDGDPVGRADHDDDPAGPENPDDEDVVEVEGPPL